MIGGALIYRANPAIGAVDNNGGFVSVRSLMASDAAEKTVMLPAPNKRDALDYECPRKLQRVRLVRNISPSGSGYVTLSEE